MFLQTLLTSLQQNFKIYKFLINFNYFWFFFFFCIFYSETKYEKNIFLNNFFLSFVFFGNQI